MKNTAAIDKIIAAEALKDYERMNPRTTNGGRKYKKYRPYTLSPATEEAREIKADYIADRITEEQYKSYCLRYNLTH